MMENKSDRILDEKQWRVEAEAVIKDIKEHVRKIGLSEKLASSNQCVYLNLTTLEGFEFCVELSSLGFAVVGEKHDAVSLNRSENYFETPYSLLEAVSPRYTRSFGTMLFDKLKELEEK